MFKMQNTQLSILTGAAFGLALAVTASAAYADDDDGYRSQRAPVRTVSEVLKNPVDDRDVRLEGQLVRRVGGDTYIFADKTGKIRVELDDDDDDDFFRASANRKGDVVIIGEIDKNRRSTPKIDVDEIYIR